MLEHALDDRSRKVRATALGLLRRLPDSAFAERMTRRVREWTRVAGGDLVVEVPDRLDEEALRDGVDEGASRPGGVAMRRLTAVVSSAPPAAWQHIAPTARQVLEYRVDEPAREALDAGWAAATALHRNGEWAAALLRRDGTVGADVAQALPRPVLVAHLRDSAGRALLDPDLLGALPAPWPRDLGEKVLIALYGDEGTGVRSFRTILTLIAHRAPFELTELLADAANRTDHLDRLNLFATAADTLTLRKTLHGERVDRRRFRTNAVAPACRAGVRAELVALALLDDRPRPPSWHLSPWAVVTYLMGGDPPTGRSSPPSTSGHDG